MVAIRLYEHVGSLDEACAVILPELVRLSSAIEASRIDPYMRHATSLVNTLHQFSKNISSEDAVDGAMSLPTRTVHVKLLPGQADDLKSMLNAFVYQTEKYRDQFQQIYDAAMDATNLKILSNGLPQQFVVRELKEGASVFEVNRNEFVELAKRSTHPTVRDAHEVYKNQGSVFLIRSQGFYPFESTIIPVVRDLLEFDCYDE